NCPGQPPRCMRAALAWRGGASFHFAVGSPCNHLYHHCPRIHRESSLRSVRCAHSCHRSRASSCCGPMCLVMILSTENTDLTCGIHFENRCTAQLGLSRGGESFNDGHAIGDV